MLKRYNLKRVRKQTVKKLIRAEGQVEVIILPCKANPHSPWNYANPIEFKSLEEFERYITEFTYYNCNNAEMGYYPSYYLIEK